jgi:hypothetical protein
MRIRISGLAEQGLLLHRHGRAAVPAICASTARGCVRFLLSYHYYFLVLLNPLQASLACIMRMTIPFLAQQVLFLATLRV